MKINKSDPLLFTFVSINFLLKYTYIFKKIKRGPRWGHILSTYFGIIVMTSNDYLK